MSHITDRVRKVIIEQLSPRSAESVVPSAELACDLGEDSLDRVELVMALEEEFEITIPDEHGEAFTDVQSVIDYITQHCPETA